MIGRLRAACRTNSAQVESVVAMSAINGLACVGTTSWLIVFFALLFWPSIAFLGNLLHPIPKDAWNGDRKNIGDIEMSEQRSDVAFALTEDELELCAELPDALVAIADYHDSKASMAAAMGYQNSADHHSARAEQLKAEAKRIEAAW